MKKKLSYILWKIIKPFYGSWIWKYWPFSIVSKIYDKLIENDSICKTIYWFKIKTHLNDTVIRKSLKINWYREKNISELIIKNLNKWDVCLDIWANIWYDTILMANYVWSKWKVYAVEPIKKNYNLIVENSKINNLDNIRILPYWAWSKCEKLKIHFSEKNPWWSSIYSNDRTRDDSEVISIRIIDDEINENIINFIKIDVEWHEFHALLGIKNIIKKYKPKIILEWSPILYQDEQIALKILSFLLENDYKIYHIHISGELEYIDNTKKYYDRINDLDFAQSDIYAIYW